MCSMGEAEGLRRRLIEIPMTSISVYPELFVNGSLFSSVELTALGDYKMYFEGVLLSVNSWKSAFESNGEIVYLPKLNKIANHSGFLRDGRATRAIDALIRATDEPLWYTTRQLTPGVPFFSSVNRNKGIRAAFHQLGDLEKFGYCLKGERPMF